MGKYEKLIIRWMQNPPASASSDEVINMITHFGVHIRPGKGSHFVIVDARLHDFSEKFPNMGIMGGVMSIPLVGGKEVKSIYIKRLVQFLQFIQETDHERNS